MTKDQIQIAWLTGEINDKKYLKLQEEADYWEMEKSFLLICAGLKDDETKTTGIDISEMFYRSPVVNHSVLSISTNDKFLTTRGGILDFMEINSEAREKWPHTVATSERKDPDSFREFPPVSSPWSSNHDR